MESLDLFLGTRAKCRETAKSPLSEVAIDVLDHNSESYLILHDYFSTFLAVEKINASRNNIVMEGLEITDLLSKYFLDIFDTKAQCLLSDSGQHRYTCFITSFCSENDIKHYFPKKDEMPGISKITSQAIVNLFEECDNDFIEVQIALGVLRDSGSKLNRSPAHKLFYEEKELIVWDSEKYNNNFLEVTYAQLTLLKSKLDHRLLAITNALKKKNKNSINFKIDYPKLLSDDSKSIETQISEGFQQGFLNIYNMIKEDQLNDEIDFMKVQNTSSNGTIKKSSKAETSELVNDNTKVSKTQKKIKDALSNHDEVKELWGEKKSIEMQRRGLCSLCFKKTSANHFLECTGPELVCFNCGCGGHNSKSCLRKPKWLRKKNQEQKKRTISLDRDVFLANRQDFIRNGLKHLNFDTLYGSQKRLALTSRGYCLYCGNPTCSTRGTCPANEATCELCGTRGHYSRLCLQEPEVKLSYMTRADQNLLPNSIISLLFAKEEEKNSEEERSYIRGCDTCDSD